jgi:hypothetical protein
LLAVAAAALPLVLAVTGLDFFAYRNLLAVWVLLVVLGAVGLSRDAGWVPAAATAALVGISAFLTIAVNLDSSLQRADWRYGPTALGHPPWPRLIVVAPFYQEGVFRIYVPAARFAPGRVFVREIDLVGYRLPPRHRIPPVGAGFRPQRVISHQKLSFVRYLAARPLPVQVLRVPSLLGGTRAFLFEPGS